MRLYAGGKLETQAEIIARSAILHSPKGTFELLPKSYHPKSRDSINLVDALGIEDWELVAFCADGEFKFMNIIVGGAPVMRKTGRTLVTGKVHHPTIYLVRCNF